MTDTLIKVDLNEVGLPTTSWFTTAGTRTFRWPGLGEAGR